MGQLQVRRLVVLDNKENKKMVGIISMGDIARATQDKITCKRMIHVLRRAR